LTDEHQLVFSNGILQFFIQYCRNWFFERKNAKNYTHSLNKSQESKELMYRVSQVLPPTIKKLVKIINFTFVSAIKYENISTRS
jgi:hypothetical protein